MVFYHRQYATSSLLRNLLSFRFNRRDGHKLAFVVDMEVRSFLFAEIVPHLDELENHEEIDFLKFSFDDR